MLDRLPLKIKLILLTTVPSIALILITIFSISMVNRIFHEMRNSIFEEHFKSTTLILNADRDMYQALSAMQDITHLDAASEEYNKLVDVFNENIDQTRQRTFQVKDTMESNRDLWEQAKDSNNRTVFENFSLFEADFNTWISICNSMINSGTVQPGWMEEFEKSREYINLIGESIDESAQNQILTIEGQKNTMVRNIIINDVVTMIIALVISILFLKLISKALLKLRQSAEKIALGDIDIDIDIDVKSNDEIGKLSYAFGKMAQSIKDTSEIAEKIAHGELEISIKPKSERDVLSISMKHVIETLNRLRKELNTLTNAASDGNLDKRGDAESFEGGYSNIVRGINNTLDAVIEPIKETMNVLGEVSKGSLKLNVKGDYKGDYEELKNMVNQTVNILNMYINDISRVLSEIAERNLNVNTTVEYQGDFKQIKNSLGNITSTLNEIIGEINNAAEQVSSGSRQVSDSSQMLSQGSTEQASSIEELTESINDIAEQTKKNAINANQTSELALSAKDSALQGNEHMKDMLKAMKDINDASASISKIIKVIDEIAFQTNILALNAAVEAARAGQHGKGFAVVAEEVRNLAARSASAAKETTSLIEGSIQKVEIGTRKANDTANALNMIVEGVSKVADIVSDIAIASNSQANGITQINIGVSQVSQVIQTNSATAEQGAAASEELSSQAEILKGMVSEFKFKKITNSADVMGNLSPDILKMIESTSKKKEAGFKPEIDLGNEGMGKY